MPTSKKRLNITLPPDIEKAIKMIAERNDTHEATIALYLLSVGLEIEEDDIWNAIAEGRDRDNVEFISHEDAWS